MIEGHLTKAGGLKPVNVVQAAEADLRRHRSNTGTDLGDCQHYAFHRTHVHRAHKIAKRGGAPFTAAALIAIAIGDLDRGLMSGKKWTRRLYADQALLIQALDHAGRP